MSDVSGDGGVSDARHADDREHRPLSVELVQELAKQESAELHRQFFEHSPVPVYVFDTETLRFLAVNESALSLYGYTRDEFLDSSLPLLRADHDVPPLLRPGAGMKADWSGASQHRKKDGTLLTVDIVSREIHFGGRPARLAVLKDVTRERARAEQQQQAQKMEAVGRLAGGIAHDFNNLLTVILSSAELLNEQLAVTEPMRADVAHILCAGQRAADLTRQLLTFSRRLIVQPRVIDLNAVVTNVAKMVQRLVGEDIALLTTVSTGTGLVIADPGQIDQIIVNLAANARDAMPNGGRLTLETTHVILDEAYARDHFGVTPGPYVSLTMADSGLGMDPATQARIFEPFYTTKEVGKGTGLGLATVLGLVQQSGGHIDVQSRVGEGTCFRIYFPRVVGDANVEPAATPSGALRGTETVLLVEDEDQVRHVVNGILRRCGYNVLEARTSGDALLLCEQHPGEIDLLLTDVVMPNMNGPQLAGRLTPLRPRMRVLFMSGYTDGAMRAPLARGTGFLQKPFTSAALSRKVREVLDRGAK